VIGPFERLNSIVGPNGTGKSTILEALSFVLCKDRISGGKFDYNIIQSSNETQKNVFVSLVMKDL
jgi:chromosome segregation ATPase